MTTYPLSLVEFRAWLESKDSNKIVGEKRKCFTCPIASALKEVVCNSVRFSDAYVDGRETRIKGELYENPGWVVAFVNKVDASYNSKDITAQQALHILDNLHICTVCNKYNPEGKNCGKDNCDW